MDIKANNIEGKVVVIIGASSIRTGKAPTLLLARQGAKVVLGDNILQFGKTKKPGHAGKTDIP